MIKVRTYIILTAIVIALCSCPSIFSETRGNGTPKTLTVSEEPTDSAKAAVTMAPTEAPSYEQHFRLKTNALGWALLISNVECEIDVAPHWSIDVPLYYGAIDYFTPTVKFRLFGIRPEVRYWEKESNGGWFVGLHLGVGGFNFALGGEYRYQSDWRRKPAVGGGASFGYRIPISKDKRWEMEFGIGLGVYSAPYNRFKNEKNARPIDSVNKIYVGPDNLAISFSYMFDVNKKGGKR